MDTVGPLPDIHRAADSVMLQREQTRRLSRDDAGQPQAAVTSMGSSKSGDFKKGAEKKKEDAPLEAEIAIPGHKINDTMRVRAHHSGISLCRS